MYEKLRRGLGMGKDGEGVISLNPLNDFRRQILRDYNMPKVT